MPWQVYLLLNTPVLQVATPGRPGFPGPVPNIGLSSVSLPKAWRGLNAGSYAPPPLPVCPQPRLLKPSFAYVPVLSSRPLRRPRRPPMSRATLPNSGVTSVGETWSVSWEGVTPPSSLVLAHAPLPLGSLLLRFLASFGESLQVVTSPCCPRQLPDVILRILPWMLDPLPRRYTVCSRLFLPRRHRPSTQKHGSASRV